MEISEREHKTRNMERAYINISKQRIMQDEEN